MANCMICRQIVNSGFVVCPECAKKLKPYTLSPELALYMDHLAETIVKDKNIHTCSLCAIGSCRQNSGDYTCRNAVKAWLLTQAEDCFAQETCA